MEALAAELAAEFGEAKLFRPYRDVRFAKDKTPYKTHQGMYVATAPATGYYAQIGAPGFRIGAGFYDATPPRLAAIRDAIDGPDGVELEKTLASLRRSGWTIGGDTVKTNPRGYAADHPRIDLLRHKTITARRDLGFDPVVQQPGLVDVVRKDWRRLRRLVEWITAHLEGLEAEGPRRR